MDYIIVFVLVSFSALFSGLNLGLFTLDTQTLKRRAELGDKNAAIIYPLRKKGNQLLATLLLGNITVNTILAVYLGSIFNGILASFLATAIIFLFGEIIPQAVFSRHALVFGAKTSPFVYVALFVFYPVAYPIAYCLDKMLGNELPQTYSKAEFMQMISEHEDSEHSNIDADEERIVHGALKFSHKKVSEVMTKIENTVMFDVKQRLTQPFFETVAEAGYSRYPVYKDNKENIIGILYAKDLLIEDENITIGKTEEAFESNFLKVSSSSLLDSVLAKMLKNKKHIAIVSNRSSATIGIITLEDIIEEIIQQEIEDEDDDTQ